MSLFLILLELVTTDATRRASQIVTTDIATHRFLKARCPSCHPTNSVKAL